MIECICTDETTVAFMIIFKNEAFNIQDVIEGVESWKFVFNSKD